MSEFEDAVLAGLTRNPDKVAFSTSRGHLGSFEGQTSLSTSKISKSLKAKVVETDQGYSVRTEGICKKSNFLRMLSEDNPGIDLVFSEQYEGFDPEEELIRKSKNPLWVVKQVTGNNFIIKRAW